jgi:hypothetical protein
VSSSRYNGADSVGISFITIGTLRNNLFSVRVMTGYVCGCSGHVEDGLGKIEAPAAHRSSTEAALRRSEAMLRWSEAALLGYKLTLFWSRKWTHDLCLCMNAAKKHSYSIEIRTGTKANLPPCLLISCSRQRQARHYNLKKPLIMSI